MNTCVSKARKVENDKTFMVLFSSMTEEFLDVGGVPVVYEFIKVFLEDVIELPPKRELEFAIDLVSGSSLVLRAPYLISLKELAKEKEQVEDLLKK